MINRLILFALLLGTWFVLSGFFKPLFIMFALVSCLISVGVVAILYRHRPVLSQPLPLFFKLPVYTVWLIKEVIISSVQVSLNMWRPTLVIDPVLKRVPLGQSTDIGATVYANSITLTPGTVSVRVEESHILVHALHKNAIEDLNQRTMERAVCAATGSYNYK